MVKFAQPLSTWCTSSTWIVYGEVFQRSWILCLLKKEAAVKRISFLQSLPLTLGFCLVGRTDKEAMDRAIVLYAFVWCLTAESRMCSSFCQCDKHSRQIAGNTCDTQCFVDPVWMRMQLRLVKDVLETELVYVQTSLIRKTFYITLALMTELKFCSSFHKAKNCFNMH